ncbi:response regulator [Piscinibacter sp.]|uniref:response regulator n=1 Tax=Piscinibacter sp. TaxID=1903157 RepID=UPI002F3EC9F0
MHTLRPAHDPAFHVPAEPPRHTVLYVEDHVVNVLLMQALFAKLPRARLVVSSTGDAGWRVAAECRPDLLLLDLLLPDCHGSELLERMRALPGLASVPAVAVTAEESFDLAGTSFQEIWMKPLDVPMTLRRLDRLLDPSGVEPAASDAWEATPAPAPAEMGLDALPGPPAVTVQRNWTRTHDRPSEATRPWHLRRATDAPMTGVRFSALHLVASDEEDVEP